MNELKELKEKLCNTGQLLDKLDMRQQPGDSAQFRVVM